MTDPKKWYIECTADGSVTVVEVTAANPIHVAVCSVGDQATLVGERDECVQRAQQLWALLRVNADTYDTVHAAIENRYTLDEARELLADETMEEGR